MAFTPTAPQRFRAICRSETACVSIMAPTAWGRTFALICCSGLRAGRAAADYAARALGRTVARRRRAGSGYTGLHTASAARLSRHMARRQTIADVSIQAAAGAAVSHRDGPTPAKAVEEIRVLRERFATAGIGDHSRIQHQATALLGLSGCSTLHWRSSGCFAPREKSRGAHQRTDFRTGTTRHFSAHAVHRKRRNAAGRLPSVTILAGHRANARDRVG